MKRVCPAASVCVLVVMGLAGGCATDQSSDVAAYRAISDPPGQTPRHELGQPLSLIDALRLTAAHNEELAAQGEEYIQALADRQRFAAALKPTMDLFARVGLRENTANGAIVQTDIGASGQYRLLTGMGDLRTVEAADATVRSRQWLILDLRESLLLQTARAYYETLRAERLVQVLESSVQAQLARLEDAKARNEVGFSRPLDVAQIESLVSRTRTLLIEAKQQAGAGRAALALLTNAPIADSALVDGFDLASDDRAASELLALAKQYRQDIVAAHNDADAARSLIDAAISQYAPTLTVNLDYFLVQAPDDSPASLASIIQLRVPVFSAGRIEADVREAWSVFRQRVLDYRLTMRQVQRDVETARLDLRASIDRAAELDTQVRVARETLLLAEASYQAGLGTNLERVTAQDDLLNAELQATTEIFVTKTSMLALMRACGLLSSGLIDATLPQPTPEEQAPIDAPLLDRHDTVSPATSPEPMGTVG